jgi:uncharacterized protein (DUF305 family)
MKKSMLYLAFIPAFIFGACQHHTKTAENKEDTMRHHMDTSVAMHDDTAFMGSMHMMMDKMNAVQMTGDFDIDFATMMIPHHEGAVEMSGEELTKGQDDSLKAVAQRIVDGQNSEIATLRDFLKTYKPSGMKHGEGKLKDIMTNMGMTMPTGQPDRDFVTLMIPHHESAIAMAEAQLKYGMSPEMKAMAQKIIANQRGEVKWFRNWLESHK